MCIVKIILTDFLLIVYRYFYLINKIFYFVIAGNPSSGPVASIYFRRSQLHSRQPRRHLTRSIIPYKQVPWSSPRNFDAVTILTSRIIAHNPHTIGVTIYVYGYAVICICYLANLVLSLNRSLLIDR
jgi:hypothetical protein